MTSSNSLMEFRDKLTAIKEAVNTTYLIENLGFKITRETSKEIRCACLIHGGDNKTAFRFNKDKRTWTCFTHKCQENYGNDIISLVMAVNKISFMDAVNYLTNLVGDLDFSITNYKIEKEKTAFINNKKIKIPPLDIVSEENLRQFRNFRSDYFINECGFTPETLDFFEIGGGYIDYRKAERDVIPIRGVDGTLLGYSNRDISGEDVDDKYIHTDYFNKDKVLYNLNNAINYIDKPIIIVEGFKSVWRLYDYGINNVVAVMGSTITSGQINLLYSYAVNGVVLMFDNDIPGIKGLKKAFEELKNKMDVYPVFITEVDANGNGLDPSDLTKEQVLNYLSEYI